MMKKGRESDARISSRVRDLRGLPISHVRAHGGNDVSAIVRRVVDEDPSPRKPRLGAFNSFI